MESPPQDRGTTRARSAPRPQDDPGTQGDPGTEVTRPPVPLWRRVVPALAIAVMVMSYVYAVVPFTFAGAVECHQQGLSGAKVAPGTPAGTIIGDVDLRCAEAGNSRIAVAGTAAAAALVVGLAGAFAPTNAEVRARRLEQAEREQAEREQAEDGDPVPESAEPTPATSSS